ncbi:MAG: FeoB-associated Cys-rich membrane protein [Deltaproteobacteria bacterium]|nr:FeoB-associated Cys-rich membrane protein [Deltaproteobacteria bacterium]
MESIIVWGIVAVAAFFSARALYRTFTGKKKNCGCRETTCPYAGRGCDQENPLC